jgi:hypothetical protein
MYCGIPFSSCGIAMDGAMNNGPAATEEGSDLAEALSFAVQPRGLSAFKAGEFPAMKWWTQSRMGWASLWTQARKQDCSTRGTAPAFPALRQGVSQ